METIYSKVNSDLLHIIVRKTDLKPGRTEVVPETNFIQCALLNMPNGKTFQPHKHIWKERTRNVIAQESWIVIQGSVRCILYDINDEIIATPTLYPGDASFTLQGGHTYEILEDDTLVYEYKTGPYEGQELDKRFI
jgi:hypothetical protein